MNLSEQAANALKSVKKIGSNIKRKKVLTQYLNHSNVKRPSRNLTLPPRQPFLEAGVYKIKSDMSGIFYEVHDINTDELLRFKDERYEEVLNEIHDFWTADRKDKFKKMGFTHKRGIILFGEAGVGKSCLMKLVMEQMVEQGDIVFITDSSDIYTVREGLREFKEIEPNRNCIVILEDVDEAMKYSEKAFLNLFDGDDQIDGVLYLATTNYIDKISERFKRPGRFDRKIQVHKPPKEGRLAYLQAKLGVNEDDTVIEDLVDKTDGLAFSDLREFLVATYCLGQNKNDVLKRLKSRSGLEERYTEQMANKMLECYFNWKKNKRVLTSDTLEVLNEVIN